MYQTNLNHFRYKSPRVGLYCLAIPASDSTFADTVIDEWGRVHNGLSVLHVDSYLGAGVARVKLADFDMYSVKDRVVRDGEISGHELGHIRLAGHSLMKYEIPSLFVFVVVST
jgi:hypothetical protein